MTYEELCSFDTLWDAYVRARRCKRSKGSTAAFEYSAIEELLILSKSLLQGTFQPDPLDAFRSTSRKSGLSRPQHSGTRWCSTHLRITSCTTSYPGA